MDALGAGSEVGSLRQAHHRAITELAMDELGMGRAEQPSLWQVPISGIPEDLLVVPAMLLQPFLVLLQADVAQAPTDAVEPLIPVARPLSGVAVLASTRRAPQHLPAGPWGWLQGAVGLVQQGLGVQQSLLAVPSALSGCPVHPAQAGGHVQCCQ